MNYIKLFTPTNSNKVDFKTKVDLFFYALFNSIFARVLHLLTFTFKKSLYSDNSFFPEKKQKSSLNHWWRQFIQILRYGRPEKYYFMYGMDVKDSKECSTYVNYIEFYYRRQFLNLQQSPINSSIILRNKFYFGLFGKIFNIPIAENHFCLFGGVLNTYKEGKLTPVDFDSLNKLDNQTLFCKLINGECGHDIFVLKIENHKLLFNNEEISPVELKNRLKGADFIFQALVKQHEEMDRLNSTSLNTIRLTTVRNLKTGEIVVWPSALRIGLNGSYVDNLSQGGIIVGIDLESGRLNEYGFQRPEFGGRTEKHPNSNIKYTDFVIPFFEEAKKKAILFHSYFTDLHSIGWDIAITPDGPLFIEGNDNWEITVSQAANCGMRELFERDFFE